MRLTCPNCGAQYEVPDEVIPETGRDVQCSNCGDTWFQHHPDHQPSDDDVDEDEAHPGWDSPDDDPEEDSASENEELPEDLSDPARIAEQAQGETRYEDEEPEDGFDPEGGEDEPDEMDEEGDHPPQRRRLDPSVADVLREEAAREEAARHSESGGGLETQPDLGLDERADESRERSRHARSQMARMRGLPESSAEDELEDDPDQGLISRRNLLPDIDEINSSLESESERTERDNAAGEGDPGMAAGAQKAGFGRGFMRGVLLVLVLVLLYLLGPILAEKVPALAGAVGAYVETVNAGRLWLSDMVGGML